DLPCLKLMLDIIRVDHHNSLGKVPAAELSNLFCLNRWLVPVDQPTFYIERVLRALPLIRLSGLILLFLYIHSFSLGSCLFGFAATPISAAEGTSEQKKFVPKRSCLAMY